MWMVKREMSLGNFDLLNPDSAVLCMFGQKRYIYSFPTIWSSSYSKIIVLTKLNLKSFLAALPYLILF